jgi:hypothetical protein
MLYSKIVIYILHQESESCHFMNKITDPQDSRGTQSINVTLELLSEENDIADLALVAAIGRATAELLQEDGYAVRPIATGQRSGEFLIHILIFLESIPANMWSHKALIERLMNDAGALVTVCASVVPIISRIFQAHGQQEKKRHILHQPIKMTVEIDGHIMSFEAHDIEGAEVAFKLAERFYESYPDVAKKVTSHSKVKVKGQLPPKPQHKRK